MAESLVESFLNCYVCSETFREPVSLGCHHSFCSSCLTKFWDQAKNTNCRVCKRKSSKGAIINFKLKELADSFAWRQKSEVLCSLHSDKLQLFCQEDKEPVCLLCQTSEKHRSHTCVPVDEAAQDHRVRGRRLSHKHGVFR